LLAEAGFAGFPPWQGMFQLVPAPVPVPARGGTTP